MNKKGFSNVVISLFILGIAAILILSLTTDWFSTTSRKAKEIFDIDEYIPNKGFDIEDELPEDVLNYASQLANQLFNENYGSTNTVTTQGAGELLLVEKRRLSENYIIGFKKLDPSLPLHMYIGTTDGKGKIYYLEEFENQNFDFIQDYSICVLPPTNSGLDGAYALQYATGIKFHKSIKSSSPVDLDTLMESHTVEKDAFFVTEQKPQLAHLVNGKIKKSTLGTKNTEGFLVLRYNKKVCFMPISGNLRLVPKKDIPNSVLRGNGFIDKDIITNLFTLNLVQKKW